MRWLNLWYGVAIAIFALPAVAQHGHDSSLLEGLEVHFAGDVGMSRTNEPGAAPAAFSLGSVDTLARARLVQHASALAEVVLENDGAGHYGFDVERLEATWEPRRWFRISGGRFHTPMGWWNTSHHHSHWMSTTVENPLLMRYEDRSGPLPLHTVGITIQGAVPITGQVGIEYATAIGNGRGPESDPPQNFTDVDERKSVLAGAHLVWGPFRTGVTGYVDGVHLPTGELMREQIATADLTWIDGTLELVAEGAILRHDVGGVVSWNRGGYLQAAWQVTDMFKPYARVERFIRAAGEAYLTTPTTSEALGGVRVDFIANAAIKMEVAWTRTEGVDVAAARAQLSWMF